MLFREDELRMIDFLYVENEIFKNLFCLSIIINNLTVRSPSVLVFQKGTHPCFLL